MYYMYSTYIIPPMGAWRGASAHAHATASVCSCHASTPVSTTHTTTP